MTPDTPPPATLVLPAALAPALPKMADLVVSTGEVVTEELDDKTELLRKVDSMFVKGGLNPNQVSLLPAIRAMVSHL